MVNLMLLAVLFLFGLFYTYNLYSHPKLRAWLYHLVPKAFFFHEQAREVPGTTSSTNKNVKQETKERTEVVAAAVVDGKPESDVAFTAFDSDGDGVVTVQELWQSLTRMGISSTDEEVADMVERLDSNGDGVVDVDEFRELYNMIGGAPRASKRSEEDYHGHGVDESGGGGEQEEEEEEMEMKQAFDVFDGNGDGLISVEELNVILKSMGLKQGYTAASCREMISKVDLDGDGKVSFEEFKLMMKVKGGKLF